MVVPWWTVGRYSCATVLPVASCVRLCLTRLRYVRACVCLCGQQLVGRLRWEDPPVKGVLYPDVIDDQPAPWSEEGRKKLGKAEMRMWSATIDNPVEVEAVAKVRPAPPVAIVSVSVCVCVHVRFVECVYVCVLPCRCLAVSYCPRVVKRVLMLCLSLQSQPAPKWLAGKVYRALATRKYIEPPPGPEALTATGATCSLLALIPTPLCFSLSLSLSLSIYLSLSLALSPSLSLSSRVSLAFFLTLHRCPRACAAQRLTTRWWTRCWAAPQCLRKR